MSECVVRMEMPHVCITENGYYGYCPMDRVWCIQRNAPPDITMREAYEAMTEKIPSWCPILCQLPEGHGRLIDADAAVKDIQYEIFEYKMDGLKGTPMPTEHLGLMKNWIADEDICPTIVPAERRET